MTKLLSDLRQYASDLSDLMTVAADAKTQTTFANTCRIADELQYSWSHHTLFDLESVYYRNFERAPIGKRFEIDWSRMSNVPDGWQVYSFAEVLNFVTRAAGLAEADAQKQYDAHEKRFNNIRSRLLATLEMASPHLNGSPQFTRLSREVAVAGVLDVETVARNIKQRSGPSMYSSSTKTAPHHRVEAIFTSKFSLYSAIDSLALAVESLTHVVETLPPVDSEKLGLGMPFVRREFIEELRTIKTAALDTSKLVRLCEELNSAIDNKMFFAAAFLGRAVLDHVPSMLNSKNFESAVSQYKWGKSNRETIQNLQSTFRNIADHHIHTQAGARTVLPHANQLDPFRPAFDVLISEVITTISSLPTKG